MNQQIWFSTGTDIGKIGIQGIRVITNRCFFRKTVNALGKMQEEKLLPFYDEQDKTRANLLHISNISQRK